MLILTLSLSLTFKEKKQKTNKKGKVFLNTWMP